MMTAMESVILPSAILTSTPYDSRESRQAAAACKTRSEQHHGSIAVVST